MKAMHWRAASAAEGALATSLSVMPCIWLPTIVRLGLTRLDQRSTILPPLTLTAAISTRSAILGSVPVVSTSTTTNSAPASAALTKSRTEPDRVGHDVLGEEPGARLDHHDRVARAGDDQVELRVHQLADGRVDDELTVDAADAHGADGTLEGDLADRQRGRGGDGADDVGVVLLVGGEDREYDMHVVLVARREQRPDGPVGEAGGEDGRFRGARLALDEAARDLARGVHPLLEVDREREEVEARAGLRAVGRAEHERVTVTDGDRAARQPGELACLDGQRATTELRGECD